MLQKYGFYVKFMPGILKKISMCWYFVLQLIEEEHFIRTLNACIVNL